MKKYLVGSALLSVLPTLAFAQTKFDQGGYINSILVVLGTIAQNAVGILIAAAVAYFIWNVIGYIRSADEEKKKEHGIAMMWGIIGLAVIVSIWGLVKLMQDTAGVNPSNGAGQGIYIPKVN